jgi:hypothetical protein
MSKVGWHNEATREKRDAELWHVRKTVESALSTSDSIGGLGAPQSLLFLPTNVKRNGY